jgi:hypothetical protein
MRLFSRLSAVYCGTFAERPIGRSPRVPNSPHKKVRMMSDEKKQRPAALFEGERPVRSMLRLLLVLGVVWAVGRWVVPFFRENVPLFIIEAALIAVECAVLLYWAFREWRANRRSPSVADGVVFLVLATSFAAGLWFLTESYLIFEVAGFSSAAVLGMAIVVVLIWYVGRFVARSYWDTKVRLAVLEEIIRQQGFDPEQLRLDLAAQIAVNNPTMRGRVLRSVAGRDLRSSD